MADETFDLGEVPSASPCKLSDDAVLDSLRGGRQAALGILYDRYAGTVMVVALRIVRDRTAAEKIVEDVFFDLRQFPERASRPLVNYLLSQARTIAIQRRNLPAPPSAMAAADADQSQATNDSGGDPNLRWQRERTRAALVRVPHNSRQIVEMICLDAWEIDDLACRLNLASTEVRALFVVGMRAFRDGLQAVPGASAKPPGSSDLPPVSLDRLRVLIVDDEPDARRVLTYALQTVGARVTVAASVAEAMALLPDFKPEVLLSDLAMPDEDGFDLIRKVRRSGRTSRELPAIALTAYASKQLRRDTMLAGFQMHVAKPADPHELAEVVASLAGRSPS